jgi:hypothetical protein
VTREETGRRIILAFALLLSNPDASPRKYHSSIMTKGTGTDSAAISAIVCSASISSQHPT